LKDADYGWLRHIPMNYMSKFKGPSRPMGDMHNNL